MHRPRTKRGAGKSDDQFTAEDVFVDDGTFAFYRDRQRPFLFLPEGIIERIAGAMRTLALLLLITFMPVALAAEKRFERDGVRYATCTFTPAEVELHWLNDSGAPLGQFRAVQNFLTRRSRKVRFLMNGGIFEEGGVASGLLGIDGRILRPINTAEGRGNFYLKPNGIFYIDARGAFVSSTEEFAASAPKPRLAIQSRPLLLRGGRTHPAFRRESVNRLHRNGVGILPDGSVLFAISDFGQSRYPNLFEFADLFRSQGCRDALFLDGDLSQMVVNPDGPLPPGNHFGAIFAVTQPQE